MKDVERAVVFLNDKSIEILPEGTLDGSELNMILGFMDSEVICEGI
jgi:hypothetical protein